MNNRVSNSKSEQEVNKKLMIISIVIVLLCGGLGFGWYQSHKKVEQLEHEQVTMKDTNKEEKTQLENKIKDAEKEKQLAIENNTSPATKENKEMYDCINRVMGCFFNYDKENYTTRAEDIKGDLSTKMIEQLFPQNVKNYMGEIESKMDKCTIYSSVYYQEVGNREALVEVNYTTKLNAKAKPMKQQSIWKVSYDTHKKQITNLEQVGLLEH